VLRGAESWLNLGAYRCQPLFKAAGSCIDTGQGSSPVIGQISAHHFLMNGYEVSVLLVLKRY
jgi:hypothetical protein